VRKKDEDSDEPREYARDENTLSEEVKYGSICAECGHGIEEHIPGHGCVYWEGPNHALCPCEGFSVEKPIWGKQSC
jgi:hypothetical protein